MDESEEDDEARVLEGGYLILMLVLCVLWFAGAAVDGAKEAGNNGESCEAEEETGFSSCGGVVEAEDAAVVGVVVEEEARLKFGTEDEDEEQEEDILELEPKGLENAGRDGVGERVPVVLVLGVLLVLPWLWWWCE